MLAPIRAPARPGRNRLGAGPSIASAIVTASSAAIAIRASSASGMAWAEAYRGGEARRSGVPPQTTSPWRTVFSVTARGSTNESR